MIKCFEAHQERAVAGVGRKAALWVVAAGIAGWIGTAGGVFAAGDPAAKQAGTTGSGAALVTVTLGNPGKEAIRDVPVTFGHLFRPGDIPAGMGLAARTGGGAEVPLQVDVKATHRDGSLRHAVVTVRPAELADGGDVAVELRVSREPARGDAVTIAELLATDYDTQVRLTLGSNAVYTASARAALEAAARMNALRVWLAGPLAGEWSVAVPVRTSDGGDHPHLMARFDVRAYAGCKHVRTDVCIENAWAYEPKPSGFTYDAAIVSGGKTVYEKKALAHGHHARWHRQVWHGGPAPEVTIKHDIDYLIATRAIPNYDRSVEVYPVVIDGLATEFEPMSNGNLHPAMPTTGAHADIGPLPHFAAVYVLTMHPRARANVLANGGCGGSYNIHYRDKVKDLPASIDDFPYMGLFGTPGNKFNPRTRKSEAFPDVANGLGRYIVDDAHQPSVAFLPYVISGDRFQLEELQFWANYNMLQMNPAYRKQEKGIFGYAQIRAVAWNMRTLGHAAYITPDAHPMKRYFEEKLRNNIAAFNEAFPGDTNCVKLANRLGALNWSGWDGFTKPWMDDFVTWSFGYLVDLGYEEARPMLMYKCRFVVGRMSPPFHWQRASMYTSKGKDASGKYFTTFEDYYKANFTNAPAGLAMDGYPESVYGYGANMQPALAMAVDAGYPGAKEAWARYETRDPKQDYRSSPVWAVVPRKGMP